MNIHPILVHFPIALLTVYSVFECMWFRKLIESKEWFYVKATLLFLGGLGALAADQTGDFGKSLYPTAQAIVRTHETFAKLTIAVFGILALIYLARFIDDLFGASLRGSPFADAWASIMRIGGSIVYGSGSDPFTQLVNQWFVR